MESERTKPIAVFMAFGTKGDVFPIAVSLSFLHVCFPSKCKKHKLNIKKGKEKLRIYEP